jgi:hypothetical protein
MGLFQDSVLCEACKQGHFWMLGLKLVTENVPQEPLKSIPILDLK